MEYNALNLFCAIVSSLSIWLYMKAKLSPSFLKSVHVNSPDCIAGKSGYIFLTKLAKFFAVFSFAACEEPPKMFSLSAFRACRVSVLPNSLLHSVCYHTCRICSLRAYNPHQQHYVYRHIYISGLCTFLLHIHWQAVLLMYYHS